jgi:hypothetical protein
MVLTSILVSALCALIFSLLLIYGIRRKVPGPLNGVLFLFLIIFMFTWAIGSWLVPVGPVHWGISWLGYLLVSILVSLLLATILPPVRPGSRVIAKPEIDETVRNRELSRTLEITFGILFWVMILVLFLIAMIRVIQ